MPLSPSESPPSEPTPNPKKPAFRRPNFRKPDLQAGKPKSATDPLSFFNRSKEHFTAVPDRKKQPSKKHESDSSDEGGSPSKRRKNAIPLSDDDSGDEGGSAAARRNAAHARKRYQQRANKDRNASSRSPSPSATPKSKSRRQISLTPPPQLPTREPTPPPTSRIPPLHRGKDVEAISLSDSEPDLPQSAPKPRGENEVDDNDDVVMMSSQPILNETDKYFAELEAKARQQRSSNHPEDHTVRSSTSVDPSGTEPIIFILVSSPIDNTEPLIIKRRMNQSLKEVRLEWCKKQGLTPDQTKDVFFVWKGNKVFDSVSCRGIGVKLDSQGELLPDEGIMSGKVHFEAVTQEIMEMRERARAPVEEEEPEVPEQTLKLILRAKGTEEFRIKVRPSTKVSELITAFCKARNIDEDRDISLDFDGDTLEPDDCIRDTELEDMFTIDVHIS